MRKTLALLATLFAYVLAGLLTCVLVAEAQQQIPTMPPNTVFGRLGGGGQAGPGGAIPISDIVAPSAFDSAFCNTVGYLIARFTGVWACSQGIPANVTWFGAACNNATDDSTAINNALSSGANWVLIPPKTCLHNSTLNVPSGVRLSGAGVGLSTLNFTSATAPQISLAVGSYEQIDNMSLTRNVTATAGGGIVAQGDCGVCMIHDVLVQNQFIGINLQSSSQGYLYNATVQLNQSHGVVLQNSSISGNVQWILDNILSEENVGAGFVVETGASGPTQISLGQWTRIFSFANSGTGISVVGSATISINGFRISASFLGQDGSDEIHLDSHGSFHVIEDCFEELAGTGPTGPGLATPKTNIGGGIIATGNNTDVEVIGNRSNGNSQYGMQSSAAATGIIGGEFTSNNQSGAGSPGISINAASTVRIVGVKSSGSSQNFGIALAAAAINGEIADNDLTGNGGSAMSDSSTGTALRIIDNDGFNPVGATAHTTMGASPFTYTAGHERETHYLFQSATNTATCTTGGQEVAVLGTTLEFSVIQLEPNESYTCTWATTAPTYTKFVH